MTGEIKGPQRAFTLTLRLGADTRADLAHALYHFARGVEDGTLTRGSSGGPASGAEYELVEIDKPHDKYFEELHAYLAECRAAREQSHTEDSAK